MESQLGTLTIQEVSLKRELSSLGQSININALNNWQDKVNEYLLDLQAGIEELKNAAHQTEDEQHEVFLLKKRIVNGLVSKVTIDKDRNLKIDIRLDIFDLGNGGPDHNDPTQSLVQVSKDGIYTRIPGLHRPAMVVVTL